VLLLLLLLQWRRLRDLLLLLLLPFSRDCPSGSSRRGPWCVHLHVCTLGWPGVLLPLLRLVQGAGNMRLLLLLLWLMLLLPPSQCGARWLRLCWSAHGRKDQRVLLLLLLLLGAMCCMRTNLLVEAHVLVLVLVLLLPGCAMLLLLLLVGGLLLLCLLLGCLWPPGYRQKRQPAPVARERSVRGGSLLLLLLLVAACTGFGMRLVRPGCCCCCSCCCTCGRNLLMLLQLQRLPCLVLVLGLQPVSIEHWLQHWPIMLPLLQYTCLCSIRPALTIQN
jgi:hypothetical protein